MCPRRCRPAPIMSAGWHVSRWAPWSSTPVAGSAELAAVGSTPMPTRGLTTMPRRWHRRIARSLSVPAGLPARQPCSACQPQGMPRLAKICLAQRQPTTRGVGQGCNPVSFQKRHCRISPGRDDRPRHRQCRLHKLLVDGIVGMVSPTTKPCRKFPRVRFDPAEQVDDPTATITVVLRETNDAADGLIVSHGIGPGRIQHQPGKRRPRHIPNPRQSVPARSIGIEGCGAVNKFHVLPCLPPPETPTRNLAYNGPMSIDRGPGRRPRRAWATGRAPRP